MIHEGDVFIDDFRLQDLGVIVTLDSQEPALQSVRGKSVTIPGKPGAYDFGAELGVRTFEFACIFESSSYTHMKQQIQELKKMLLDPNGRPMPVKLTLGDENDRYYNVRIDAEITVDRKGTYGYFPLVLTSFDGHAWSTTRSDEVVWGSEVITFESDVYTYGHSGDGAKTFTSAGSTNVTVSGGNVQPILFLNGSGSNVTVSCAGKTFTLGTFTDANWLIDLQEYVVLKNGVNALHVIKGDWIGIELVQGDNQININGSGLNLDFSVEFHDRYF